MQPGSATLKNSSLYETHSTTEVSPCTGMCFHSGRMQLLLVGKSIGEQAVVSSSPFEDHWPIGAEDPQGPGNFLHEVAANAQ